LKSCIFYETDGTLEMDGEYNRSYLAVQLLFGETLPPYSVCSGALQSLKTLTFDLYLKMAGITVCSDAMWNLLSVAFIP